MGQVIDLKTKQTVPTASAFQTGSRFFCTRCNQQSDQFKIMATGSIHCADCDARMTNIKLQVEGVPKHVA